MQQTESKRLLAYPQGVSGDRFVGRPQEVSSLIKTGHSPSQIAKQMKLTISSVKGYLWRAVGEGHIVPSDIVFAIAPEVRYKIEELISRYEVTSDPSAILEEIQDSDLNQVDTEIYLNLRRAVYGDLYGLLHKIELHLHAVVKKALIAEYGESGWWDSGVPVKIKDKCRAIAGDARIEGRTDFFYRYTSLSDIAKILETQWGIFRSTFPVELASEKFFSDMRRLIRIRNNVMHPVKGTLPLREDYHFVERLYSALKTRGPR